MLSTKKAIKEEVIKLLQAGFIREMLHITWLENVVPVEKSNGGWRMCVDYIDLNKACCKDSYPLSNINHLVDNVSGFGMLSFRDAFSRYNRVKMHPDDKDKTAFITNKGVYCYQVMLFTLKNARATYQRMMNIVFSEQIERNMDDILIKSREP